MIGQTLMISVLILWNKRINLKLKSAIIETKKLKYLLRVNYIQHKKNLRDKLLITEKYNLKQNRESEINKFCTYNGNINQLYLDMLELYFPFISYIENEYPSLKRNDIIIITLINNGYDNHEISAILNYTKRTIYKRRQIISKVLNISSLQLDEHIKMMGKESNYSTLMRHSLG